MTDATNRNEAGLVEDRRLVTFDEDRLGHKAIVHELRALVCSVQPPANIALYGRWGAGKSSVAELLDRDLEEHDPGVAFTTFDAFKWAETPLRRHFVAQVATGLGQEFDPNELYEDRTRTQIDTSTSGLKRSFREALRLVGLLALILLVLPLLASLVLWLLGHSEPAAWLLNFVMTGGIVLPAIGGVFLYLSKLTGESLRVTRRADAPTSGEQFETAFATIIKNAMGSKNKRGEKTTRVVVFVDELDRCASNEVVATLEAIKTFLGVPNCVFIVAADQQVLEQALTESARQNTPSDRSNPYYSSGSAYLDKIFNHQLSIPPALPRRLSTFALELVEEAGGTWDRVPDRDRVVTVLIPTHVRSPRRVKILLNSYITAYRLLQRRCSDEVVRGSAEGYALQLAKLVCLRVEFPLFADKLSMDPRFPEYVYALAQAKEDGASEEGRTVRLPATVRPEVEHLANQFVKKTAPLDVMLDKPDQDNKQESREVHRAYANALLNYLRKTSHVPPIPRDLVHLEAGGAAYGLDPVVADDIEYAAVDRNVDAVRETIDILDPEQRTAALRLLGDRLREAAGVEEDNILAVLLKLLDGWQPIELETVADGLLDAVIPPLPGYKVSGADLRGAYVLAVEASAPKASELIDIVLEHDDALSSASLGLLVVETAHRVKADRRRLADFAAVRALDPDTTAAVAERLAALDEAISSVLTRQFVDALAERWPSQPEEGEEPTEADEQPETLDADEATDAVGTVIRVVGDAGRDDLAVPLGRFLLDLDTRHSRDVYLAHSDVLGEITDPGLAVSVVRSTAQRSVADWPRWLDNVRIEALAGSEDANPALKMLAVALWEARAAEEAPQCGTPEESLARFDSALPAMQHAMGEQYRESLNGPPTSAEEAKERERLFRFARQLAKKGLLTREAIADATLEHAQTWATHSLPGAANNTQARRAREAFKATEPAMHEMARWSLARASKEAIGGMLRAITDSQTLEAPRGPTLLLEAAAALQRHDEVPESPLARAEVEQYADEHRAGFDGGIAAWVSAFARDADDAWFAIEKMMDDPDRVTRLREPLDRFEARTEAPIAEELLRRWVTSDAADAVLSVMPGAEESPESLAQQIVTVYADPDLTNPQRERVLKAWTKLKLPQHVRDTLIRGVFIPMATHNVGCADAVYKYRDLVANPPSVVLPELRAAVEGSLELTSSDAKTHEHRRERYADIGVFEKRRKGIIRGMFGSD